MLTMKTQVSFRGGGGALYCLQYRDRAQERAAVHVS